MLCGSMLANRSRGEQQVLSVACQWPAWQATASMMTGCVPYFRTWSRAQMYSQAQRQEAGHSAAALPASSASTRAQRTWSDPRAACISTHCMPRRIVDSVSASL